MPSGQPHRRLQKQLGLRALAQLVCACCLALCLASAFVPAEPRLTRPPLTRRQAQPAAAEPVASEAAEGATDVAEPFGPGLGQQKDSWPGVQEDPARDAWKRELLRLAAGSNRGFGASGPLLERIVGLVEQLEGSFKAPQSSEWRSSTLEGSWAVIFTSSPDLVSLDRLPLPFWRTARIGQAFGPGGAARNEIEFESPIGSRVNQTVQCSWDIPDPQAETYRVALTFRGSSTKLAKVAGFELPMAPPPLSLPLPPATGVFKVSYLDGELLVQRTQAGGRGINVLVREGAFADAE